MQPVHIRMLGEFAIESGGVTVSDSSGRSKKVWGLLAYMICNRNRVAPQQKLIDLLYGDECSSSNPENALRITLHRIRSTLDGLWPNAGKFLVQHKDGGYRWTDRVETTLDCDRFEELTATDTADEELRLSQYLEALRLYRGEFLPKHSSEPWVVPIAAHFHNRFIQITMEASQMLYNRGRCAEAVEICRKAVDVEPYHEPLHQMLMRALGAVGDQKGAATVYDALSKRLFDDFGIRPNPETREVYRISAHSPEDRTLPMDEVLEQLQEPTTQYGAMVCDYDYFKILCFAESRTMERSGHATHIALLSVTGAPGTVLSKRTQDLVMEQLGEHMRINLRRGDTIAQCSVSQYIMMLPKANYENSCMVCRRILAAFHQSHPRAQVKINYMVQPLTPSICVP